ncbi:polysaccharide biosynthesis protein [Enterobacter asburiae]|uniref:polysaccharide biosynthesis protein n=1 Tax=Enterobacter asburiae TaxID=61645 RepID=UPI00145989FE|nr:nucleoside-diphosphate sugar epimerase/dehydratase [Enterobacter asburiae]NME38511.1 polysaccharide biosynthesis protein [Enterobacter asburiae]
MLTYLISLPRPIKRIITLSIDVVLLMCAFWFAFWVRIDSMTPLSSVSHWLLLTSVIVITLAIFVKLGLYRAVIRYITAKILLVVAIGMLISSLLLIIAAFYTNLYLPRTIPFIYFSFGVLFVAGSRLAMRMLVNRGLKLGTRVIIYGAGASGRQLLPALSQMDEYYPVAFVDDNRSLQGQVIHGVSVFSPEKLAWLIEKYEAKKILLAMPSASRARKNEVISTLEGLPCEVLSIPGMVDLVEGKARIDALRKVVITDLLGRDPVTPIPELISKNIQGKTVMVTGAGGSIGSELCRQIIRNKPTQLILFELSEFSLYSIDSELRNLILSQSLNVKIYPILGNVQDMAHLERLIKAFSVETIYHAAAYKHVPLVEFNVIDGVRNNIFGTLCCAQAAENCGVESFVLISTDKAVRPTNTMGATKRMAELILQALASESSKTCFSMVRFGNVLGSSGSVVPLFEKQIAAGGPVTLTHPDITRYFMTIPEAAQLVIQAGAMGSGGDVFVLDMGDPVKIIDLAHRMIALQGLSVRDDKNPYGDIAIKTTGLRPGEKLYEELLIGDNVSITQHPRIKTANEVMLPWNEMKDIIAELDSSCRNFDYERVREILLNAPTAFNPTDDICDLLWKEHKS